MQTLVLKTNKMKKLFILIFALFTQISQSQLPEGYNFNLEINLNSLLAAQEYTTSIDFNNDGTWLFVTVRSGKLLGFKYENSAYNHKFTHTIETPTQGERGLVTVKYNNGKIYLFNTGMPNEYFDSISTTNYLSANRVSQYSFNDGELTFIKHLSDVYGIGYLHNGGGIAFDDEDYMYSSYGDGGDWTYGNVAQARGIISEGANINGAYYSAMTRSLGSGKILRVDPNTGLGHPNNPYYDANNPDSLESKIYATGFRNPWRMSWFDGVLYVADVGATAQETIYAIKQPGVSGAWSFWEGLTKTNRNQNTINPDLGVTFGSLLQDPTSFTDIGEFTKFADCLTYGRATNTTELPYFENGILKTETANANFDGASVVGGIIVNDFSPETNGKFLFMDWSRNWLGLATLGNDRHFEQVDQLGEISTSSITSIVQNPLDGNIYMLNYFRTIYKLSYEGTLSVPTHEFNYKLATVYYTDITGRKLTYINQAANGLYFAYYEYEGKTVVRKEILKDGKIINKPF